MTAPVISCQNLTKDFRIESAMPSSLFNRIRRTLWIGSQTRLFRALNGVSFSLARGQSLGLIGNNGAGKSTLLRLLSGIYRPTAGSCQVNGCFTPVLELGVGMHHELSVRENVFLYGAIIGFRRPQIVKLFDEIIAFADLQEFVDARVKELSTGMRQRLTFAVTAYLDVDLIMVDEILAVGDRAFREKSFKVFDRRRQAGKSQVLASHDMDIVNGLCDACLLLDRGEVRAFGPTKEVLAEYGYGR